MVVATEGKKAVQDIGWKAEGEGEDVIGQNVTRRKALAVLRVEPLCLMFLMARHGLPV